MTFPTGKQIALPPSLESAREAARKAVLPIKAADSNTEADQKFLFTATRTDAGRKLPPYYLVYFLLVDLLGFPNLGRFEKLAWSVPIDFEGLAYLIDHRKFGVGVFAREGEESERQARRIVGLIHNGVAVAKPFFRWMAENAVRASELNVRNVGITVNYSSVMSSLEINLGLWPLKRMHSGKLAYTNNGSGNSPSTYIQRGFRKLRVGSSFQRSLLIPTLECQRVLAGLR
jgi:hypothetical protein